jgi:hypothetical protein
MPDCFISYKREDRDRTERIAAALRDAGHSVWWDTDLPGGARWRDTIVAELDAARCVLVCWTHGSVGPAGGYVREEAERAKHRGVLLPLLLDGVTPPFGFGEVQALDLVGWDGRPQAPEWQAVLRAIEAILSGKRPAAATLRRRRWAWAGGAIATLLTVIGLVADLTGLQTTLCQPQGLNQVCRWAGWGPSDAELAAWQHARPDTSGEGLKDYLASYPGGAFAAEAQARLAACREVDAVSWVPYLGGATIVVPSGPLKAASSEAAARLAMQAEVQRDAEDACAAATVSELYRALPGAKPALPAQGWDCRQADAGWRCRYDGKVSCQQERRQSLRRRVCPPS